MAELAKPNKDMLLRWLWLSEKQGVRPSVKIRLFRGLGGIEEVYRADKKVLSVLNIGSKKELQLLLDKNLKRAEEILCVCNEKNIKILNFSDENYPNELKRAYDPPLTLYLRGREIDLKLHVFAHNSRHEKRIKLWHSSCREFGQRRRLKRNGIGFGPHKGDR